MKFLSACLLIFILTFFQSCNQRSTEGRLIKLNEDIYDFGNTSVGDTAYHSFKLTNNSSEAIKILDIQPGCSCLVSKPTNNIILPSKSMKLLVGFSPRIDDVGVIDRMIAIRTTSKQRILILHVKSNVSL